MVNLRCFTSGPAADVAVISLDMYNDASRLIDSNFDGESLKIASSKRLRNQEEEEKEFFPLIPG